MRLSSQGQQQQQHSRRPSRWDDDSRAATRPHTSSAAAPPPASASSQAEAGTALSAAATGQAKAGPHPQAAVTRTAVQRRILPAIFNNTGSAAYQLLEERVGPYFNTLDFFEERLTREQAIQAARLSSGKLRWHSASAVSDDSVTLAQGCLA